MSANLTTTGFIDLATFDELDKYMYGCGSAITYFVKETRKSTWFTQLPVLLQLDQQPDFGSQFEAELTRSADYLCSTWITVTIPKITFSTQSTATGMRWTEKLMHNLVKEVQLLSNDLVVCSLNSVCLDFWIAFTLKASLAAGYERMIGNVESLYQPVFRGGSLPKMELSLPLPLFYARDSGVAIPMAALPYCDMKIRIKLATYQELLIVDDTTLPAGVNPSRPVQPSDLTTEPRLSLVRVYGNYSIVSNDERKRMGCGVRDVLIEQFQWSQIGTLEPDCNYPIHFSNSVKVLFFGLENITTASQHSNYGDTSPLPGLINGNIPTINNESRKQPIENTSLYYENSKRLDMSSLYYSHVQPWYQNATIPKDPGYNMYSYSLNFQSLDPMGSTNYGKLTNVSLKLKTTDAVSNLLKGTEPLPTNFVYPPQWINQNWWKQKYNAWIIGINNNIIRFSGGSLGFPVL